MISSMYVLLCNNYHGRRANGGKITTFKEVPLFDAACSGLLELRGSGLELLKSAFTAKSFICRLSWSISSHFGAIHS